VLGTQLIPLVKVNPKQARRFAQASGKLAKTDRVDCEMLAKMGGKSGLTKTDTPQWLR
jgi:transposase